MRTIIYLGFVIVLLLGIPFVSAGLGDDILEWFGFKRPQLSPVTQPFVQTYCENSVSKASIVWSGDPNPASDRYWIAIAPGSYTTYPTDYWDSYVLSPTMSVVAPSGGERTFWHASSGTYIERSGFNLQEGSTYSVWISNGVNSPLRTFTASSCAEIGDVSGEQKIAVILVDLLNDNGETPLADYQKAIFDTGAQKSITSFITEASYGKTWLTGDVYGWYHLKEGEDSCSRTDQEIFEIADNEVYYPDYDRIIIVFRENCPGAFGSSSFGKKVIDTPDGRIKIGISHIYFDQIFSPYGDSLGGKDHFPAANTVFAHELGHSFGINGHAITYECGKEIITKDYSKCSIDPYSDVFDVMGGRLYAYHFNGNHKKRLGWFEESNFQVVSQSGVYTLYPLEEVNSKLKVIKVPLKNHISISDKEGLEISSYLLEFRQSIGFDEKLKRLEGMGININGILIRGLLPEDYESWSTYLLDMTPESLPDYPKESKDITRTDFVDSFLNIGKEFYDPDNDLRIKVKEITSDGGINVEIKFSSSQTSQTNNQEQTDATELGYTCNDPVGRVFPTRTGGQISAAQQKESDPLSYDSIKKVKNTVTGNQEDGYVEQKDICNPDYYPGRNLRVYYCAGNVLDYELLKCPDGNVCVSENGFGVCRRCFKFLWFDYPFGCRKSLG